VRGRVGDSTFQVLKPQTYMNRSGAVLSNLRAEPSFDPAADLLVIVDEVALPLGSFRLRATGSAGGHNGLKSVEGALRTQEYARLRIGVGPIPLDYDDMADYVLEPFQPDEARVLEKLLDPMADAVACWLDQGIETAMNRYNPIGSAKRDPEGDPERSET
jgi:PTH1 family peptidyl-tRNA hydrolase